MMPPQTAQDGASSLEPPAAIASGANASRGRVSNLTVWLGEGADFAGAAAGPWPFPFPSTGPSRPIARRSSSVRNSRASQRAT